MEKRKDTPRSAKRDDYSSQERCAFCGGRPTRREQVRTYDGDLVSVPLCEFCDATTIPSGLYTNSS